MPLPRPALGDTLLVAHPDGSSYNAKVTSVLGQFIYFDRGRFHVSDHRLGPTTWENNDVVYHLLPNGNQDGRGRKNVVQLHNATAVTNGDGGAELVA